ncbi:hypothetical protein F5884DRAFT_839420 [Xylogone sp. PMI_703]|nr:hypothetical protein F5884DRAFT_839420 [Xylogone sp. PMI_703]
MTAALHGWHPGEVIVQRKLGYAEAVSDRWMVIEDAMREQHRIFHTSNLPFIPITAIDENGLPWASIVAGATGDIGFVRGPDLHTLIVNARLWEGEPLLNTSQAWIDPKMRQTASPERFLTAGLGIEFPTRRRNKFAAHITEIKQGGSKLDCEIHLRITETTGNCPKYINVRKLVPYPHTNPSVAYQNLHMQPGERLSDEVIKFITEADTIFIASVYNSDAATAEQYPSHAGMNARGGLPGFIRVSPTDGRTVVVPEFSGNRFVSSLGNIESSGVAGLTIVSFTTGDILYITGSAKVLVGPPAFKIMPRQACLTSVTTTGFKFIRNALPVRQEPGSDVGRSPYSPKIKYLYDEPESKATASSGHKARLIGATPFGPDIATLRFAVVSKPGLEGLKIRPGQAIVLDFMDWIGPPVYRHMANEAPGSINDDRVRTWTVSSAHEGHDITWFELTMREMKGGAVTGALFNVLREQSPNNELGHAVDIDKLNIAADIVGVTGDFYMGHGGVKMLWVAGGIGITPFMSMLSALVERDGKDSDDIILALSTREPEIFSKLLQESLQRISPGVRLRIDLFTNKDSTYTPNLEHGNLQVSVHRGRIQPQYWKEVAEGRDAFICGPGGFGDAAVDGIRAAGVPNSNIHREGFY